MSWFKKMWDSEKEGKIESHPLWKKLFEGGGGL